MQFEWDKEKAKTNLKKHGVSFDEAETVFGDPLARIFDDDEHFSEERRDGIVRSSVKGKLLIVSFTERKNDTIRIISARETTPKERRKYKNADG
ncbi:BrnT family toxin [soil metagenome]|jgi:uncharacterized DUF497 family protein|nr:BrnT family toxin [Acidobacteriota bacterium]